MLLSCEGQFHVSFREIDFDVMIFGTIFEITVKISCPASKDLNNVQLEAT